MPLLEPPLELSRETAAAEQRQHGTELKRGAFTNTVAMLASNFRGIFTFLVARLLGPAALGTFSIAWATTDLLGKLGMFGLDNAITIFLARSEASGDRARSRSLFRLAVTLAVLQCFIVAGLAILFIRLFEARLGLDRQITGALSVMLCAMPGVTLYRMNTAVSRGLKVMRHDIFSRGLTETTATTLAFLALLGLGLTTYAPELAGIIGTAASGIVALFLAASLFRRVPRSPNEFSYRAEAGRLLAFAAPITAYDFLNAFIVRLDVIMLGCFIGRAPGVTLPVVGIYGAVVEVAGGLRKVNQVFNPIFAPIVASLTIEGEQQHAAAAFSRVAQWMLWMLLPPLGAMILAGPFILGLYGSAFREGGVWLGIVGTACATNAFVGLAETVIMVQKPHHNLLNSSIAAAITLGADVWLIPRFGVTGAAFGILLPYVILGILRYRTLRSVFRWRNPWADVGWPLVAGIVALAPALVCRTLIGGLTGQVISASVFLLIFLAVWLRHRAVEKSSGVL
jgi:O-antigen/teichoic acid export membrane protein